MITDETRDDYIGALDLLDIKSTLRPSMPRYDRLTKDAAIKKLDFKANDPTVSFQKIHSFNRFNTKCDRTNSQISFMT